MRSVRSSTVGLPPWKNKYIAAALTGSDKSPLRCARLRHCPTPVDSADCFSFAWFSSPAEAFYKTVLVPPTGRLLLHSQ